MLLGIFRFGEFDIPPLAQYEFFCFLRKTSSTRAIGAISISWRVVEYGDSWERHRGVYLEGFCRSRARVGVSNRLETLVVPTIDDADKSLSFNNGRIFREIIILGLWGNYDRKAETWRNWRKGTPGVEPVA